MREIKESEDFEAYLREGEELFLQLPPVEGELLEAGPVTDCGGRVFNRRIDGVTREEYDRYLKALEAAGYVRRADNGTCGLGWYVYNAVYIRDGLTVTAIWCKQVNRMFLSVGTGQRLSEHLVYHKDYVSGNLTGAKTTLHMPEQHTYGDTYIIQMKNGRFLLVDGGMPGDVPYLFDYLETLVPKGVKPVVEAWFISHGHGDHIGPFSILGGDPSYADRIYLEGVYCSEPGRAVCARYNGGWLPDIEESAKLYRNLQGEPAAFYRPQLGDRYYFNDFCVDIMHTQEQLPIDSYSNGFNDSSTWMLFQIEGQRFLDAGDAGKGSVEIVREHYHKEYLNFDLLSVFHHGQNVYEAYADDFTYRVLLYPTFLTGSQTSRVIRTIRNERLQAKAEECLCWGDGGKVLTFPYVPGTSKTLPMRDWIYNPERRKPVPY